MKTQPRIKVENKSFLAQYTRVKMASWKRETYQTEQRTYVLFICELAEESKIVNKTISD